MILNDFETGWKNVFEERLVHLQKLFPNVIFTSKERFKAMLRIKATVPGDRLAQKVVDNVLHCIERDSARVCERCGKGGRRIMSEEYFSEPKTYCVNCYAIVLDEILQDLHEELSTP